MDAVARGDKRAWLDNFADDGLVQDPIGKSMIDPTGEGHRGKAAIEAFWDNNLAAARPMFCLQSSIACGDECANVGTLMIQFPNGMVTKLYGIFVYRVNDDGKVASLRTYWEPDEMQIHPPFAERGA
jgi:ketosteroid isomerase-like protein